MNTFLPYPDFTASAQALDYRRLGKQRVECAQIINAIMHGRGWSNHPATRMWVDHIPALMTYQAAMIDEWVARGYRNSMTRVSYEHYDLPWWIGDEAFHASHRSNLLRKDFGYYSRHGWTEPHDLPYVWPG